MTINSLLSELNTSQSAAATFRDQHALVLAGAGCGKTKTIIARAAYLISEGVHPERIQILTFTRRAASEIVERVRMHLGDAAKGLKASTFHTWCMSLVRRAPSVFGCKDYSVIDRDDQLQLFKVLRGQKTKSKLPTAADLCDIYSFARNTLQTLGAVLTKLSPDNLANKHDIASVMLLYEARKRERRYLDYDDILDIVAQRMATSVATQEWVARQYDHILVDEMQDTNPLQWKLINPLQKDVKLFCVGDDAQSIYGFRGADFQNVHSFSDRVQGAVTLRLEQNYRSTQQILDVSNWLLSESPLNYDKNLVAVRGAGSIPQLRTFSSEWEEGRWIADDLMQRRAAGADWLSHMILARSAFAARVVESALVAKSIPYRFVGGPKLLESAHVRDLLSVLRIVGNPQDEIAWMRYLTLWPGVGEVTANRIIVSLLSQGSLENCLESMKRETKVPPLASKVIEIVRDLHSDVSKAVSQAAQAMDELLAAKYKNQEWDKRKRDFRLVEKLADKHSAILAFIEEYLLDPVHGTEVASGETEDVVTVTTIHSAKGTECDVCYVVNVSPGAFPPKQAQGDEEETEEERRVLYVALTRAKNELIVTRHGHGIWATSGTETSESCETTEVSSYFLNTVPESLFEHQIGIGANHR